MRCTFRPCGNLHGFCWCSACVPTRRMHPATPPSRTWQKRCSSVAFNRFLTKSTTPQCNTVNTIMPHMIRPNKVANPKTAQQWEPGNVWLH